MATTLSGSYPPRVTRRAQAAVLALVVLVTIGVVAAFVVQGRSTTAGETLRVGLYENPPKIFTGEDGAPAGLFPELLDAVAADEGWDLEYVPCEWSDCLAMVEAGELDLMPDVAWTAERARLFDLNSVAVANGWSQVFVRDGLEAEALEDLGGLRIAVLEGGIQQDRFADLMAVNNVTFTEVPRSTLLEAYQAVEDGDADAVVTNRFFEAWNGSRFQFTETPIMFLPAALYFAAPPGANGSLLDALDSRISEWKADPSSLYYSALYGSLAGPPTTVVPVWIAPVLVGLLVAMALAIAFVLLLRWEVRRRTEALAKSEERRRVLETRDPLTGLPNRQLMMELVQIQIDESSRTQAPFHVLLVGLDHFSVINETFGREGGHEVLVRVGILLESIAGDSSPVARIGDDEFVVLVAPDSAVAPDFLAQRILGAIQAPIDFASGTMYVGASIGIATFPENGATPETLMRSAEAALRLAKEAGHGVFRFPTPGLSDKARERVELAAGLRHALDYGEFVLHYQPQLDLATGDIVGVEALLRWQHPDRGTVSPAYFIDLAEETGLILPLGEWVVREACRQIRRWTDAGVAPPRTAVNISAAQLVDSTFLDKVEHALRDAGADPDLLGMELTESVLVLDQAEAQGVARSLKDLGVEMAIDDFGTGYSSLAYLESLPVDVLKVDLGFVHRMTMDEGSADIVHAIIALGHSLGLRVLAEGVETEEQRDLLIEMDCDAIQGFLIAPALPPAEMTDLLVSRSVNPSHSSN